MNTWRLVTSRSGGTHTDVTVDGIHSVTSGTGGSDKMTVGGSESSVSLDKTILSCKLLAWCLLNKQDRPKTAAAIKIMSTLTDFLLI